MRRSGVWEGAGIGVVVAATGALLAVGTMVRSGRGVLLDALFALIVGWVGIGLLTGLLVVTSRPLRRGPPRVGLLVIPAIVVVGFVLAEPGGVGRGAFLIAGVFIVAGLLAGAGLEALHRERPSWQGAASSIVGLVAGVVGLVSVSVWLAWGGGDDHEVPPRPPSGTQAVATLTYGSGEHRHRPEFASDVDIVTPTVDGTPFLEGWSGWSGTLRTNYWGFGPGELPLNARVWSPAGDVPGPLVLIVHGNHPMEVPSDEGYAWLAEELASHGYVVAAIDQNFLNGSVTRGLDLTDETDARAWLLLEHLRLWRGWQDDPTSRLHGRVDLDRIALIGHSRGGEAVAHAAYFDRLDGYPEDQRVVFDAGFGIDVVVAIAANDGQYRPAGRSTRLRDVSYLTLHGGRDADHPWFLGLRQYARTEFSGDRFAAKAAVYLEDANHGQFNTRWGRRDLAGIAGRMLHTQAVMPGQAQRDDARAAIVAWLDATLRDDHAALDLLRDSSHAGWSQATRVVTRYADSTELVVVGGGENRDPASIARPSGATRGSGLAIWSAEPAGPGAGGHDAVGVVLGWDHDGSEPPPTWTVRLGGGVRLPVDPILTVDISDLGSSASDPTAGPPDVTIEVESADGTLFRTSLDGHDRLLATAARRRLKPPLPDLPASGPIPSTVSIPLGGELDTQVEVAEIRLVFDRTPQGRIRIERIALRGG